MLQCGDPNGDGTGGPGYEFGPVENAPKNGIYRTGVIAMARASAENSQGSQFFIVYGTSNFGPGTGYTVFGECEPVSVWYDLPALLSGRSTFFHGFHTPPECTWNCRRCLRP